MTPHGKVVTWLTVDAAAVATSLIFPRITIGYFLSLCSFASVYGEVNAKASRIQGSRTPATTFNKHAGHAAP